MNIAIVGLGDHVINKVLPAILANNYNCVGIVSSSTTEKTIQFLNKYIPIFKDINHLKDLDLIIDCVYISTPIATHFVLAGQSLELGYNVICEKPLCTNYKETSQLFNIAHNKGLFLFEVNMHMHHYQFKLLDSLYKRSKNSNYFGKIQKIILSFCIPHLSDDNFRYDPQLGGGAIYDVGFYPISSMLALEKNLEEKFIYLQSHKSVHGVINKSGNAFFMDANSVLFELRWCMGQTYENYCQIIYEDGDIYFDRFFSKPNNLDSLTSFSAHNKVFKRKLKENHFEIMLKDFKNILLSEKQNDLQNYKKLQERTLLTARFFDKYF